MPVIYLYLNKSQRNRNSPGQQRERGGSYKDEDKMCISARNNTGKIKPIWSICSKKSATQVQWKMLRAKWLDLDSVTSVQVMTPAIQHVKQGCLETLVRSVIWHLMWLCGMGRMKIDKFAVKQVIKSNEIKVLTNTVPRDWPHTGQETRCFLIWNQNRIK